LATRHSRFRSLFACLLPLLTVAPASAGDWPQWRGPGREGVWHEAGLPERLPAEGLKPRWRQPMGGGYGGVAVSGSRVYVMDRRTLPREVERVLCLDAGTGKTIWEHTYPVSYGKLEFGNGPRTTPTVRAGRVWTYGTQGHLFCLETATGKVIWARDTVKDWKGRYPTWGHACSPLLDGPRLLVQVGAPDGCLFALDAATGKELWRALADRPGYSSPVIAQGKGWRQAIYWTAQHVAGLDPETGTVLWKVPFEFSYDVAISDLVFRDGLVLASNYWTGSKAIRLDAAGKAPEIAWEGKQLSLVMSTPLVRDGHVYAVDRFRGLKCIEMATGKVKWEGEYVVRRGEHNPQAALVWAGARLLIFNDRGELILAEVGPNGFRQLGKAAILGGQTWAHPAFADRCIFARNDEEIVCVPVVGP
jgi:outer membrane protein assembly factor BamB